MSDQTPTQGTLEKLRRWSQALKRLDALKREISSCECECRNAANDLGKWMVPDDCKKGEEFNIWIGDGIIAATQKLSSEGMPLPDYIIRWRNNPSAKVATEMNLG